MEQHDYDTRRQLNTASRLPTYRHVDVHIIQRGLSTSSESAGPGLTTSHGLELELDVSPKHGQSSAKQLQPLDRDLTSSSTSKNTANSTTTTTHTHQDQEKHNNNKNLDRHFHNTSSTIASIAPSTTKELPLPPTQPFPDLGETLKFAAAAPAQKPASAKTRKPPAAHSRNGLLEEYWSGPPPAMITQGSFKIDTGSSSTTDWVASQRQQQEEDISPTSSGDLPVDPVRYFTLQFSGVI